MKLYHDAQLEMHLKDANAKYENNKEAILGIMLNQPNEPLNSSSRKIMTATQSAQKLNLINPEVPLLQTGYEDEFGRQSSSFVVAESNQKVLAKIEKYTNNPGSFYYLITINDKNEINLIERKSFYHSTESYGFLYSNDYLDALEIDSEIKAGDVIKTSTAFNKYGQHMDGVNLNCCYMALAETNNDPVVVSESGARKLASPEIRKVDILINDNDIPLNLYGNLDGSNKMTLPNLGDTVNFYSDNIDDKNVTDYTINYTANSLDGPNYKIFPDVGEDIKNGVLCGIRKENKDQALFSQSIDRLSSVMISDTTYKIQGKVVDINVYSNKRDEDFGCYDGQLKYYIEENRRFAREFIEEMAPYIDNSNYKKSYEITKMYHQCTRILNGDQYIKDNKIFSNIQVELYVYTVNELHVGDKLSNRYGGKGVVSFILPDNQMPMTEGLDGSVQHCELIWNQATCVNRLNSAQLVEMSLNYISKNIQQYLDNMYPVTADKMFDVIYKYFNILSPEYAQALVDRLESGNIEIWDLMDELVVNNDQGIYLTLKPISECVTFDKLRKIYQEFPWIKTKNTIVPIKGSDGNYRFVKSNKKSIMSAQYVYRLKQYAEEKFSATSLSATNIRNENSKSKASKMYIQAHSATPIKMGEMESNIYIHLSPEIYITNLMLYSTSPQGRRSAEVLLTGDPYNIDVKLDPDAKSRSVEKLNAALKTMGLRFVFKKIPKVKKHLFKENNPYASKAPLFFSKAKPVPLFHSKDNNESRLMKPVQKPVPLFHSKPKPVPLFYSKQSEETSHLFEKGSNSDDDKNQN